ncbi:MAG: PEP-CTERM sorting domain-containing protein, partial [Planctomycetota bacterium]
LQATKLRSGYPQEIARRRDCFGREALLNDSAPDVAPGSQTWTALESDPVETTDPHTDGSVLTFEASRRNMYLPFTPGSGVYELSVQMKLDPADDSTDWAGLGFMGAEPRVDEGNMAFGEDDEGGRPWVLLRQNGAALAFAGPGATEDFGSEDEGTYVPDAFHTLKVTLDTTGAEWTVDASINGSPLGETYTYTENPDIGSVGISTSPFGGDWEYTFDNFSLVPEPTTLGLLGLGSLATLLRRRRR